MRLSLAYEMQRPMVDDHAVLAAIRIYQAARQGKVVRIAKIDVDLNGNMCLNMQDGVLIQFGQDTEIPDKLKLIRDIYSSGVDIASRLAVINVTCPSNAACTPRSLPTSPQSDPPLAPRLTGSNPGMRNGSQPAQESPRSGSRLLPSPPSGAAPHQERRLQ